MMRNDCTYFRGEKPWRYGLPCEGCSYFKPFPVKTLIIKCRAMGDVLRTTSLPPRLKRKYPQSFISWLLDDESTELLLHNPHINRVIPFHFENILPLLVKKYDILISLDKEAGQTALATRVECPEKYGFGLNDHGNLEVFNTATEYAYELGVNNDFKVFQKYKDLPGNHL